MTMFGGDDLRTSYMLRNDTFDRLSFTVHTLHYLIMVFMPTLISFKTSFIVTLCWASRLLLYLNIIL